MFQLIFFPALFFSTLSPFKLPKLPPLESPKLFHNSNYFNETLFDNSHFHLSIHSVWQATQENPSSPPQRYFNRHPLTAANTNFPVIALQNVVLPFYLKTSGL